MGPVRFRGVLLAIVGAGMVVTTGCGSKSAIPGVATPSLATAAAPAAGASSNTAGAPPTSSGAAAPSATAGAAPPAAAPVSSPNAGTTSNIEQLSGWESCDTCSGGGNIAFSMTQGLNYPQLGSTQFTLGQGAQWAHALWWKRLGSNPNPSHFVLTLDEYIDHPEASFGIEYEANQIVDGQWYDFAAQCSFGYGIWQLWDPAGQHWTPTSVPCSRPAPASHVKLRLEFARSNGQAVFVSIGTDGNVVPVNMAFNPQPINGANGDYGVHIQLNANGNPDPYSVWVHNMALNYW